MGMFTIFCLISCVSALSYGTYYDGGSKDTGSLDSHVGYGYEDVTVTVVKTVDEYRTATDTFYNSVPVTLTEFLKSTVTLPTREIVRTPVNDVVKVSTIEVTRPITETVTDVLSRFKCSTEVSTEFYTITHLDQRILQTTVTSTIVATHIFHPTIVQTVILTEKQIETETAVVTDIVWVGSRSGTKAIYY